MFLDKKGSKSPVSPLSSICPGDIFLQKMGKNVQWYLKCTMDDQKESVALNWLYHKDIRAGCLNQHGVRDRKTLTECRIQRSERCPICQGITKHTTYCKVLIVLRLFAPLSSYYQEKQLSWNDNLEVIVKTKHITFWFWHNGRRSVSHETILAL